MIQEYMKGEIGAVYVVYKRFINTMKQEPVIEQLLPHTADRLQEADRTARGGWDYLYEPDAKTVLEQLLRRYLEAIVYQALAENIASEQSARMVAMKAASDNASNVIDQLTLVYNKSRQASITKELSEIVGGAAAV
jgi:F-type H+-transporting ATPase subunit gamma